MSAGSDADQLPAYDHRRRTSAAGTVPAPRHPRGRQLSIRTSGGGWTPTSLLATFGRYSSRPLTRRARSHPGRASRQPSPAPAQRLAAAIACDGSAMSAGRYQSDIVLESAEGAQPPTPRQVAREFVREVRARDGREGDVATSAERPGLDLVPFVACAAPAGVA
jgi:hypothetical protein